MGKTFEEFMKALGHELCPRCHCCDVYWVECSYCAGEGMSYHDCGEDCCACLDPENNMTCDICDGEGGWWECLGHCDENGKHEDNDVLFDTSYT